MTDTTPSPVPELYDVKLSKTVSVLDGRVTLRPRDKHVVNAAVKAEIEAQGALADAKPA